MAKIINGLISGTVGPLMYYAVNGVQMVKQKAVKVKQSKRTKVASKIFAKAAQISSDIRNSLSAQLPNEHNQTLVNALNGAVFRSINHQWKEADNKFDFNQKGFSLLDGFEFDAKANTSRLLRSPWKVTHGNGKITVSFDQVNVQRALVFPDRSMKCEIVVGLTLLRLRNGLKVALSENQTVTIKKTEPSVGPFKLSFEVPAACLCIVTMFLRYYRTGRDDWKLINSKKFNPGCIQKAVYTAGKCMEDERRKWTRCPVIK